MAGNNPESLSESEWEELGLRLLKWVNIMAFKRPLPPGFTSEEIVQVAIEKVLSKERAWNPEKHPSLFNHLTWIVKSLLSDKGLYGRKEVGTLDYTNDSETLEAAPADSPDRLDEDEMQLGWKALEEEFADDDEMRRYLEMLRRDEDEPARVHELAGIAVSRVYELRRKLESRLPRVRARVETLRKKGWSK